MWEQLYFYNNYFTRQGALKEKQDWDGTSGTTQWRQFLKEGSCTSSHYGESARSDGWFEERGISVNLHILPKSLLMYCKFPLAQKKAGLSLRRGH